jgi:excisionase family DNA binding protein
MSDLLAAALIAALASVTESVLTFIVGIRSVRRSVSTANGEPLGRGRGDAARPHRTSSRQIERRRRRGARVARLPGGERPPTFLDAQERAVKRKSNVGDAHSTLAQLLTVSELAELLQVLEKTIYSWRYRGEGPPGVVVGRHLRYRPQDVAAWLETQMATLRHGDRS